MLSVHPTLSLTCMNAEAAISVQIVIALGLELPHMPGRIPARRRPPFSTPGQRPRPAPLLPTPGSPPQSPSPMTDRRSQSAPPSPMPGLPPHLTPPDRCPTPLPPPSGRHHGQPPTLGPPPRCRRPPPGPAWSPSAHARSALDAIGRHSAWLGLPRPMPGRPRML
jgi:hypothetical protein